MQDHEYSLLGGINRAKVGRYISLVAASVSGAIVFVLLALEDVAHRFNIPANLPPTVLSLVGAGTVFAILYWIFDKYVWRWPTVAALLKVPNLAGDWRCEGQSLKQDGTLDIAWSGVATIVQSWDKLRIRLKTAQSASNSITAAVLYDSADGFRLLYNYRNEPNIDEPRLSSHVGFTDLLFDKDLRSAEGLYFNGHGRFTYGTMKLTRR
jgi:hypothetical protein